MLIRRLGDGPVLTAGDWPVPVNAVFNPGASLVGGETVLVCRVEDTTGQSHLWLARSTYGVGGWRVDDEPWLSPDPADEVTQWGLEDARVTRLDELGCWAVTCTAYGPAGPAVYLVTTADFVTIERGGLIMPPEDKNAALLPRRIDGDWILLHRPVTAYAGQTAEIWLSRSRDLESWRRPERVLRVRSGPAWDSVRIGIGPPPIETDEGWLLLYHGVRKTTNGDVYRVGVALLDRDLPTRVLAPSPHWVLSPQAPHERVGDVPNVVFPCGVVAEPGGDLRIYYGAADTSIGVAAGRVDELLEHVHRYPVP